jgi:hypothetical protein
VSWFSATSLRVKSCLRNLRIRVLGNCSIIINPAVE